MRTFDCTDIHGNQIVLSSEPMDELTRRLTAPDSTEAEKEEAAETLAWLAEQIEKVKNLPQLDQAGCWMVWNILLSGRPRIITTVKNGKTTRTIEPVE